jgi:hypothetical protein
MALDSETGLSDDNESQGLHPFIADTKGKKPNSQDDKSDDEDATGIVKTGTKKKPYMIRKPVPPAQPRTKQFKKKNNKAPPGKPTTLATKLDHATTKTKSSLKATPGKPSLEDEQNSQLDDDDDTGIKEVRSVINNSVALKNVDVASVLKDIDIYKVEKLMEMIKKNQQKRAPPEKPTTPATKLDHATKSDSAVKPAPGEPTLEDEQDSQEEKSEKFDNHDDTGIKQVVEQDDSKTDSVTGHEKSTT